MRGKKLKNHQIVFFHGVLVESVKALNKSNILEHEGHVHIELWTRIHFDSSTVP